MSRKALEVQLSETQRELELSTFLNKGVLQSNSEFKLRIAELEQENTILRKAESRLAKTEDKAELAERRVKELVQQLRDKQEEWAEVMRLEAKSREGLEREIKSLREEAKSTREGLEEIDQLLAKMRQGKKSGSSAGVGPSRILPSTRTTPIRSIAKPPKSEPTHPQQRQRIDSPTLPQSSRLAKRRRRIGDSADTADEPGADDYAPSSPVPQRTPRTATTRTTRANSSTKKLEPQSVNQSRRRDKARTPPHGDTRIKLEQRSPSMQSEQESEDDPLCLE